MADLLHQLKVERLAGRGIEFEEHCIGVTIQHVNDSVKLCWRAREEDSGAAHDSAFGRLDSGTVAQRPAEVESENHSSPFSTATHLHPGTRLPPAASK